VIQTIRDLCLLWGWISSSKHEGNKQSNKHLCCHLLPTISSRLTFMKLIFWIYYLIWHFHPISIFSSLWAYEYCSPCFSTSIPRLRCPQLYLNYRFAWNHAIISRCLRDCSQGTLYPASSYSRSGKWSNLAFFSFLGKLKAYISLLIRYSWSYSSFIDDNRTESVKS